MNGIQNNSPPLNYWQDSVDCWQRLPNKAIFFGLLAVWLLLFQFLGNSILGYVHTPSLFLWMREAYRSSTTGANDDSHGNLIPFLVAGLFWWKRKELLASAFCIWWPGLLILAVGTVLHVLGYIVQQPAISIMALFTGIYGLMGLAWGPEWLRKSLFPFCLFVFSVPLGARSEFLTFPLRQLVTWLVAATAHWVLGIDVIRMGTQLIDPTGNYQYDVAAACSGIRSLIAIFLLSTCYSFIVFRTAAQRLGMILLAIPFAVLGNYLRLLFIIVAAELGGQEWGSYVHESPIFSLVPYVPAFLGVFWIGNWMQKKGRLETKTAETQAP